jgi:exopolysaccharide biosynthesis protein
MMVLDGRQEPFSCGGSMEEIAQIMYEAGCVHAVNLDGGGSTEMVVKEGNALKTQNDPSDGKSRPLTDIIAVVISE